MPPDRAVSRRTVLYIDDNPDDRSMVHEAARSVNPHLLFICLDGYALGTAYLGGEGHFADRERYPEPMFVFLDYALNGHTGVDLLRWIRARKRLKGLPISMYCGSDAVERLAGSYREGVNYYLCKARSFSRLEALMKIFDKCVSSDPPCYDLLLTLPEYRPPP